MPQLSCQIKDCNSDFDAPPRTRFDPITKPPLFIRRLPSDPEECEHQDLPSFPIHDGVFFYAGGVGTTIAIPNELRQPLHVSLSVLVIRLPQA
jgi:hypothetical protein